MDSGVYEHLHPDWRAEQRKAVEAACEEKRVWVAESGGSVVGFVAVELHRESGMGEIYMLAVDPDFRGGGVGTNLTEFALAWMAGEGMSVAMVETGGDPGHAPARRAYEKAGFDELPISRYFKKL